MASKPGAKPPTAKQPPMKKNVTTTQKPGPKVVVPPKPAPPPPPVEPVVPVPVPAPAPQPEPPRKVSMSAYGNLLPNYGNDDKWDENLIPQRLIDEIYAEFSSEESSSEESYEEVTESGTVIRRRRKKHRDEDEDEEEEEEEEEEETADGPRRISLPDVEGGIPKSKLKNMSVNRLKDALSKIQDDIKYIQTENIVLDRTISKMEQREREIEAALPAFTYKFPWETEKKYQTVKLMNIDEVCKDDLSSDEDDPDFDGVYIPVIPENEVDFNDPYFETLSDNTKEAFTQYMHNIGEVAPANFDVFRHNYGNLVKPTAAELLRKEDPWASHVKDGNEDDGDGLGSGSREQTPSASQAMLIDTGFTADHLDLEEDEDPEFPGFVAKLAKKLPITEKLKYAHMEEECMRDEFFNLETDGIKQENSVQVYIDTFVESFTIITKLMETFKAVLNNARHPLTGKLRAERIMRFREKVQKRILGEETKVAMRLMEAVKQKKKVDLQLKSNRELGESIQLIDYEKLKIENAEFQQNIEREHGKLKELKIITASIFQQLKEHREKLARRVTKTKQVSDDVIVRGNLKKGFDTNFYKYTDNAEQIRTHSDFLKKRLKAFVAPSTMDYIGQKATQHNLKDEVVILRKKVNAMDLSLRISRNNYQRFRTLLPANEDIRSENQVWLDEVKREVEERGLMSLLNPGGRDSMDFFMNKTEIRSQNAFTAIEEALEQAAETRDADDSRTPTRMSVFEFRRTAEAQLTESEEQETSAATSAGAGHISRTHSPSAEHTSNAHHASAEHISHTHRASAEHISHSHRASAEHISHSHRASAEHISHAHSPSAGHISHTHRASANELHDLAN